MKPEQPLSSFAMDISSIKAERIGYVFVVSVSLNVVLALLMYFQNQVSDWRRNLPSVLLSGMQNSTPVEVRQAVGRAEAEAAMTLGMSRPWHKHSNCSSLDSRLQSFCFEGEGLIAAFQKLRERDGKFVLADLDGPPEFQLGWGIALSSMDVSFLKQVLNLPLNLQQKKYIADGWGFGAAARLRNQMSTDLCEANFPINLQRYCLWGYGRSHFFTTRMIGQKSFDTAILAGQLFAQNFAGDELANPDEFSERPELKNAIRIAQALRSVGDRSETQTPWSACLAENHILDCAAHPVK